MRNFVPRPQRPRRLLALQTIAALTFVTVASGGNASIPAKVSVTSPADRWSYADIADMFLATPVVLTARVADAIPVPPTAGAPATPGVERLYILADVETLIRGSGGVAPRVAWLADVPLDSRGKLPKLKKSKVIVAALPVAGRPGELRLVARDAMQPWSGAFEGRVRDVVKSGLAIDAPPRITGINNAFHSAGTLPGEGETQIFLTTANAQPVSLSVLRRPGEQPNWAMALGEIVDEAARPPARDTLGWYRMACSLPRSLPPTAVDELAESDAAAAREDYAFVMQSLGQCTRMR